MIPPLTILLPILFLGGIVSTISGGGLGIMLTVASTIFLDVRTSIVLVALLGFVIQLAKILHFYRFAQWQIIGWYLLLGFPLSFVGALFLFLLPERLIEVSLGLLCIGFALSQLIPRKTKIRASKLNLVVLGGVNGLIGGVIGQGSLMRLSTLMAFGLSKEQFVGTSSIIAFIMNIGKSAVYAKEFSWTKEALWLFIFAVPTVLISVWIGKWLLQFVSPELFEKLLLVTIFLGGIRLLFFP